MEASLDKGESSAIALAMEYKNHLLLIDEHKGRTVASVLGLSILGTFGIMLEAKNKGIIVAVKPLLDKIKATNFRFSDKLLKTILEKANEV